MATRKSSIRAELEADKSKWSAGLQSAAAEGRKFAGEMRGLKGEPGFFSSVRSGAASVLGKYAHLRAAATDVVTAATRLAGAPAMYADMTDALTATTGSAEEAAAALDFLGAVAIDQKLEFEPLVEAYQRLRSLGYSAQQTRDFIRELGNAVEFAGGSSEDLTGVVSALGKISDKGEVAAKQLMQMGDSLPYLRKIFKDQFGAETAADIDKLNLSAEQLFEGIMRGLKGVENSPGGVLDALSPEYLASVGRLRAGRAGTGNSPILPDLPDRTPQTDPEAANRVAKLQAEAAAAREAAAQIEIDKAEELQALQQSLEEARSEGDRDQIASLEDQISLLTDAVELAKKYGIEQAKANEAILRQNAARRAHEDTMAKIEAKKKAAAGADSATDAASQIAITEARARGDEKGAKKLEQQQAMRQQYNSLVESGVDPATAAQLARRQSKAQEQAEEFQRTGRRRITSSGGNRVASGLTGDFGQGGGFLTPSQLQTTDASRDLANSRAGRQNSANQSNDPALKVLEDIRAALLSDKKSVAEKTASRR